MDGGTEGWLNTVNARTPVELIEMYLWIDKENENTIVFLVILFQSLYLLLVFIKFDKNIVRFSCIEYWYILTPLVELVTV